MIPKFIASGPVFMQSTAKRSAFVVREPDVTCVGLIIDGWVCDVSDSFGEKSVTPINVREG